MKQKQTWEIWKKRLGPNFLRFYLHFATHIYSMLALLVNYYIAIMDYSSSMVLFEAEPCTRIN